MKANNILIVVLVIIANCFSTNAQNLTKPKPELQELFYENKFHERITELYSQDEYIYMVIKSKNAIGQEVDIELEKEEGEYIYKNMFLAEGYGTTVKIQKDIHKIKLVVYDEYNKKHVRLKRKAKESLTN